jgi:uncharacterized membrane protein
MKSKLVFFDELGNSKVGTLRGLSIFPVFILITLCWFILTKDVFYERHLYQVSYTRKVVALLLSGLFIVSALGVHVPSSLKSAVVYGGLVGLVVYGVANLSLLAASDRWGYFISFVDTLWGVVSTAGLAAILYWFINKYKLQYT